MGPQYRDKLNSVIRLLPSEALHLIWLIWYTFILSGCTISCPTLAIAFDPSRLVCREGLILAENSTVLVLKWANTFLDRFKVATLYIPVLHWSDLCPVTALHRILDLVAGSCDQPLFKIFAGSNLGPLTDSVARRHLKAACQTLQLNKQLMFYYFRRGI